MHSALARYVNPHIFARKGNGFLTPPFHTPLSFYMRSDTSRFELASLFYLSEIASLFYLSEIATLFYLSEIASLFYLSEIATLFYLSELDSS